MSNAVYPDLPGLTWPVTKVPEMKTLRQTSASGKEKSAALWSYPRWHFKLQYEYLSDDGSPNSDFQQLVGFFLQRRGSFEDFLFLDKTDHSVTDQVIGIGDGSNTVFQLVRSYGAFLEPVNGIVTAPELQVDGKSQSFNWDNKGLITFEKPPVAGAKITASFNYYYRVRFEQDSQEFEYFMHRLWTTKSVELVTVK